MRSNLWVVPLLLAAAACQDSASEPLSDLIVAVGEDQYLVGEPIPLEIRNVTTADAFFYHCNYHISVIVQKEESNAWVDWAWLNGPMCLAIYSSGVLVLVPGSGYENTIELEEPGNYRVAVETGRTPGSIGSQMVYSTVFAVEPSGGLRGRSGA